jgi:hypothetical protein
MNKYTYAVAVASVRAGQGSGDALAQASEEVIKKYAEEGWRLHSYQSLQPSAVNMSGASYLFALQCHLVFEKKLD